MERLPSLYLLLCATIITGSVVAQWFPERNAPTRPVSASVYKYDRFKLGDNVFPVRISPKDGTTDILFGAQGWGRVHTHIEVDAIRPLPPQQLDRTETFTFATDDLKMHCTLYNGSDWLIKYLLIRVRVVDPKTFEPVNERIYRLTHASGVESLTHGTFEDVLDARLHNRELEFHTIAAFGIPRPPMVDRSEQEGEE